ncbi:unnamed protein product [Penicillium salamii]|nr:unnamed protein product [Penicillium salamii]
MTEELSGDAASAVERACDRCRKRKIRCDRKSPCSNCRSTGSECRASTRPRQKRARVLLSSQFEEKINQIDARLNYLVESLTANDTSSAHAKTCVIPQPKSSLRASVRTFSGEGPSQKSHSSNTNDAALGQSSFTAQSTFAIELAHTVVGSSQLTGSREEVETLLGMLSHIRTAFNERHDSSSRLFPLIPESTPLGDYRMPPLETAVQLLQKSHGGVFPTYSSACTNELLADERCFMFLGLSFLLQPRSLSDICLKVYFTSDYSDADFIIVNAALHFLASETDVRRTGFEEMTESDSLSSICQRNLEIALSKLTLYIQPSYEMTLALTLGVTYAIHVSNASLAGVLANSAYQCSYSLGLHKHSNTSGEMKQGQFLFWVIYFLEKTLSVRLGRSSIIQDQDIEQPSAERFLTYSSHFSVYAYQMVQLAGLAGRIYEQLYSPKALSTSADTRTHRALELSQELHTYHAEARNANQLWAQSTSNVHEKGQIEFASASDDVMRLSILTLIYRAMPQGPTSRTTFGLECITSARCALESHQAVVRAFGMQESPLLLSSYVNWYVPRTILFTPFTPFTIIFCHCIETRDKEDLNQMHSFLKSIESACQYSSTITKHHHLFSIFYNVALRYYKLGSPSSAMEEEQIQLRSDVDAQLTALGVQTNMPPSSDPPSQEEHFEQSSSTTTEQNGEGSWEQDPWLERWFSFNQQMMGLVDGRDLPF